MSEHRNLRSPRDVTAADEWSAGGVVMRVNGEGGFEVLLIEHRAHDTWGFPKGHVDEGESAEVAAVREVVEETGVIAEVLAPLEPTHYTIRRKGKERNKVVSWFLMRDVGRGEHTHAHEVRAVEWMGATAAQKQLTYDLDRALLDSALELYSKIAHGSNTSTQT